MEIPSLRLRWHHADCNDYGYIELFLARLVPARELSLRSRVLI